MKDKLGTALAVLMLWLASAGVGFAFAYLALVNLTGGGQLPPC